MPLDVSSNAAEVARDLDGAAVTAAAERANRQAADLALALVAPGTPRRSGTLAAGLRTVVASEGWALVDAVPYASIVDARTGFATKKVLDNQARIVDVYDIELQATFDRM
jgi:hypothetical protein